MTENTKVFITYSWEDKEHIEWVNSLAKLLDENGFETITDKKCLQPGDDMMKFMESSIQEANYVLVICTPDYKNKYDAREGGVGYEGNLMATELYFGTENKFIPVLRKGDKNISIPMPLASKFYVDLTNRDPTQYKNGIEKLLETLKGEATKSSIDKDSSVLELNRSQQKKDMGFIDRNKSILEKTLDIFQKGYYEKKGRRIELKTSKEQRMNSIVLLPENVTKLNTQNYVTDSHKTNNSSLCVTVNNKDTFTSATEMAAKYKDCLQNSAKNVLVLNFANPIVPAKGVRNGTPGHEQDLCRTSSLLLTLESPNSKKYYDYNKMHSNLGTDAMILSPYVEVIRDEKYELLDNSFVVSVLTCAAPNIRNGLEGRTQFEYKELFYQRIQNVFQIAFYFEYSYLVLGAWGCGFFKNEPKLVADLFYLAMKKFCISREGMETYGTIGDAFDSIDFAVCDLNKDQHIYKAFAEKFSSFHA